MPRSPISLGVPASTRRPSTTASMPCPASALNDATGASVSPRARAPATTASPRGCSLDASADARSRSSSSSPTAPVATTSVSTGRPSVIVPVLSSTIVRSRCASSRLSPPLISTPSSAPFPVPTIIAVGVASPSAHGHAMISTDTKFTSAIANRTSGGAITYHTMNVTTAIARTTGVKIPLTTSAIRAIGAFEPCASWTSLTICCSAVSLPTFVAPNRNAPVLFIVPANTSSPSRFSTGMLSPVSIDSSTVEAPSVTRPSTGTFSPGRIETTSPTSTSAMATSTSAPRRTTRAVRG